MIRILLATAATSFLIAPAFVSPPPINNFIKIMKTPSKMLREISIQIATLFLAFLLIGCGQEAQEQTQTEEPAQIQIVAAGQTTTPINSFKDCDDCPEMIVVPAGSFMMGSLPTTQDPFGQPSKNQVMSDEMPQHQVTISRSFAIGKYEVTQQEWYAMMGTNPSCPPNRGRTNPVNCVSHAKILEFIQRLNAKTTQTYRLPSEAEWEFVARAGTTTLYFFGDDSQELDLYAWYRVGNTWDGLIHPVGEKEPNPWGLYDVYGNVAERIQGCHNRGYTGAPPDGSVARCVAPPDYRLGCDCWDVVRGGSWFSEAWKARSASREETNSSAGVYSGFRLAREIDTEGGR